MLTITCTKCKKQKGTRPDLLAAQIAKGKFKDETELREKYLCRSCRPHRIQYVSRADRASELVSNAQTAIDELEQIKDEIEGTQDEKGGEVDSIDQLLTKANELVNNLDFSDLDNLKDEMDNWRDNMSGTNLENSQRYQDVEEAADTLDNVDVPNLPEIETADDIDEAIEMLQEIADSGIDQVNYPGMYG